MPLTLEQFNLIKNEAMAILDSSERKEALLMAKNLEPQIEGLELSDPNLYNEVKKMVARLKWTACPAFSNDEEFFKLFRENFLEGLEMEYFNNLITEKLAIQFEAGLYTTLAGIISALRENTQTLGANPLLVKNEARPVKPVIRNWLIDFLRNTPSQAPAEIDETNYLFNNSNAKALSENDQKTLGKVLAFYDTFRLAAQEAAQRERKQMLAPPPNLAIGQEKTESLSKPQPQTRQQFTAPQPESRQPAPQTPPRPAAPPPNRASDSYRETVAEQDLAGPIKPIAQPAPKSGPRVQGNVVDLKDIDKNR